jgi:hypothetical protein
VKFRATILVVPFLAGCAPGLQLELVEATWQRPSNVAVYFAISTKDGDPVPGLTADAFRIYEDEQLVSTFESRQTILNPEVAAIHYTLLLVDMSASVVDSGQVPQLVLACQAFASRVGQYQQVAVYTFDGREDIQRVVDFTRSEDDVRNAVIGLQDEGNRDPSTNLNGAIVKGIERLRQQMDRSTISLRFGTLVVFTDGTDHAARVSRDQMLQAIATTTLNVYAIAVGGEIDQEELEEIGREGFVRAEDGSQIVHAFDLVAQRIEAHMRRYYLLSYCSPARAGEHQVTIEAVFGDLSGTLQYGFDANGFEPGCDPNRPPSFDRARRARHRTPPSPAP